MVFQLLLLIYCTFSKVLKISIIKTRSILPYIAMTFMWSFATSCSNSSKSLDSLYPNEVNEDGLEEGNWLWYVSHTGFDVQELSPVIVDPGILKVGFIGMEMSEGEVVPGSTAKFYSLDSALVYEGNIVKYEQSGRDDDPYSYAIYSSPGDVNAVRHYRLFGNVYLFNRQEEVVDTIVLEMDYVNEEAVELALQFINVSKNDPNSSNYFSRLDLELMDSLQANYAILMRTKNDRLIDDILDIIVRTENLVNAENSSRQAANDENQITSSSNKMDQEEENSYLRGKCRRCSSPFYKGSEFDAMTSWADGRSVKHGTGWVMIKNRNYCEGVKQDVSAGEFCSEYCALDFCNQYR